MYGIMVIKHADFEGIALVLSKSHIAGGREER